MVYSFPVLFVNFRDECAQVGLDWVECTCPDFLKRQNRQRTLNLANGIWKAEAGSLGIDALVKIVARNKAEIHKRLSRFIIKARGQAFDRFAQSLNLDFSSVSGKDERVLSVPNIVQTHASKTECLPLDAKGMC